MVYPLRIYLCAFFVFLALLAAAEGAVVNATWNSATDVPVTASSYTVTGNTVNFTLNFAPPTGTNLTVVKNTGLPFINGTFDNLAQGQAVDLSYGGVTYHFVANYYGGTGNDLVLVWAANRVFAWGQNNSGQIGDTTTTQRNIPVPVVATGVLADKTVIAVAPGSTHSLALCSDGTLVAWGDNTNGQLGNNTTTSSSTPVAVSTADGVSALAGKTVVAISAGGAFSMALCSDGTVATWGSNSNGQLGINSTASSNVPVLINTASGTSAIYGKNVVAISTGHSHSVALCSDGTVSTWGWNTYGQLGINSAGGIVAPVPVLVNTASGVSALYGKSVVAIAAGWNHTMALCSDGSLASWGANIFNELGDNTTVQRNAPVAVNAVSGTSALYGKTPVSIAAGFGLSLALCTDGTVLAWGTNSNGQLGDTTTTSKAVPVAVNRASGVSDLYSKTVASLGCGGAHGAALCTDGMLVAWGSNFYGQLGVNSTIWSSVPKTVITAQLNAGEVFASVSTGAWAYHVLAVVATPPPFPVSTTLAASSLSNTTATFNGTVNASQRTTSVSFDYGLTTAYGSTVTATPDSLSDSTTTAVSAVVTGLTPGTTYHFRVHASNDVGTTTGSDLTFTTLNNNAGLTALVINNGTLTPGFATGITSYTASVDYPVTTVILRPTLADTNASVKVNGVTVTSGSASTAIPLNVGTNTLTTVVTAQDGTTTQTYSVTVTRTTTVPASFAAATDGPLTVNGLTATGSTVNLSLNYAPATGTNLMVVNNTGVPFINGTFDNLAQGQAVLLSYNGVTYKFVANYYGGTGNDLVLAWAANRAFAWGDNSTAQIGDGTATQRNVMVPVTATGVLAGKTILALSQGSGHSLGLCSDGTLAAWGTNYYGTLGNGNNTSINFPVTVNTASGVSALYGRTVVGVSAGTYFSLAVCSDGSVVSWGYNPYGQLGNNGTTNTNAPVLVNTASGTSALYGKTVVAVSAGTYHSVALCSDGTVAAWGYNNTGQLGNNTTTSSTVPVAVNTTNGISALYGKTVVAISAGDQHTMALCSDGTVVAWGDNIFGDLGNNSGVQMKVPVAVNTTNGVSALYGKTVVGIAAGNWLSLALCADGTVAAWGYNNYGQLGNNTTTNSSVPVLVNTASGTSALHGKTVVGIAAVGSSCTALCTDGTVATWGYNYYGQLGNNTTNNSLVPQLALTTSLNAGERVINPSRVANEGQSLALVAEPVPTVTTLAATAVGSANATLNGTVNPNNGIAVAVSFDYGTTTAYGSSVTATPGSVTGGSDTAVSAALSGLAPNTTYHFRVKAAGFPGSDQTFTTLSNDASLAGLASSAGALSPAFAGGTISYATPAVGSGTTTVTCTPTVSESHATVTVNGVAVTSGSSSGPISLGSGTTVINVQVTAQDGVTKQTYTIAVPGSTSATFATATDVPVSANGFSASGSTVDFTLNYAPVTGASLMVVNNTGLGFISGTFSNLSQGQAVALVYNGVKYNYVANYYGGTGNDLVLVWAGNRAMSWGSNLNATLGDGTSTNRLVPVPVTATGVLAGKVIVALSAGSAHGLALCSDGTVAGWGGNWYGQLGDNTYNSRATPVAVNTASGVSALYGKTVVAIAAGYETSMALCSDGTVVSWGSNSIGQIGDGTTTTRIAPVAVNTASGVSALYGKSVVGIAAGSSHSVALCSDGTVVAWGSNASGQLGNNSTTNSPVPVKVNAVSGVSSLYGKIPQAVAAGTAFSMALCSDGSLASWGSNAYGQLGDNTFSNRSVPGAVNAVSGTSALYGKTPAAIAAGWNHSMTLCSDGTLLAWGSNSSGQLGDNSATNRPAAVAVNTASGTSALYGRKVLGLAGGSSMSAAFCAEGTIVTWGGNTQGQLGNNSTSNSSVPVTVSTSTLSAGENFATVAMGPTAGFMFATAAAPPAAPAAATLAATSITTTGGTLNGTANASGNTTTVSFEFGPTTSYGTTVAATPATLTDSSTTAVAASLTGLTPGTTYHYRVKAVSGAGTANGSDQTFTTISTNANLTGLALNNGTLSPVFAGGTTSYTATVGYPVTSITLRPTLANAGASMTVNGLPVSPGSASAPVSLSVGDNTLITVVTAQDGTTTQTYTVTVTRAAPSTNARLASLTPSVGILSPAFDSSATSYTVTVPFGTTSMTLTPTVADSTSSVQVNGTHVNSGSASGPLAVDVGSNFFSVVVTAQDGVSTQTYSVTGVRPALPAVWSTLSDVPLVTTGFTATGNTLGALTLNFAPATGTNLMVVKNTGLGFISGTFSNLSQGQAVAIMYNG
ncbi:MAG: cadherin-like beta sandwich domain-containing protein, partial [Prosthecobacter sp.]|uniref:RCC1 domain-containing protein n=1 Tax=Prosthecobacter sp. TaxID=1965333 RepID=UPI003BAEAF59